MKKPNADSVGDSLNDLFDALEQRGMAFAYFRWEDRCDSGDLPAYALRSLGHTVAEELGRREALDFKAREILRGERSDRQKLQAIQKLMGWGRPSKRDPRELCRNFDRLRSYRGSVMLSVLSGPRAPLHEVVQGCPLSDSDALATLKRLYAANSEDAILQALHAAKKSGTCGISPFPLPTRRAR